MTKSMPSSAGSLPGRYRRALVKLFNDPSIHPINRDLFRMFFEYQERKLKRINGLPQLDLGCYRTLYVYIVRFRNVNRWFGNRPLTEITRGDIRRVYDGLEEGTIVNAAGKPYQSRSDYFNKVFKSKLFQLAGKQDLAREVIEFYRQHEKAVRFIREDAFRRLVAQARQALHQLLFWLNWDFGENINAQLQLLPSDFHRQLNPDTREPEYRVSYRREILKRSRCVRSEINNHPETVELLDQILPSVLPGNPIFPFDYANARKIMRRAVAASGVTCEPHGDRVTWKDLRSSMACDLLGKGWSRDEVNARLGHRPSSTEIDAYINYLAIDRHAPKQKLQSFQSNRLQSQLDAAKERERLQARKAEVLETQMKEQQMVMEQRLAEMRRLLIAELREEIDQARLDKGQDRIVFRAVKISELIDSYDEYCVAKGLAPKSLSKYRSDLSKLFRFACAERIHLAATFEEDDFHRFRIWLQQQKHKQGVTYSPKSVGSALLVCKQVFKFGWQRKIIPTYTLAAVPLPKAKARPQPCFTTEQVEQLLALVEGEEQAVLATLAYAGLRIGEAEQLLWEDVLFDRGELGMFHIRRGGSNGTTKNKADRFVPIHPRIRPLLEGLGQRQGLVFPAARERRLLARLKSLCRQAGFTAPDQYKLHSFRHHFAFMCANHHVAHRKALAWMGHSSSGILELYYHLTDIESESAMKALAQV